MEVPDGPDVEFTSKELTNTKPELGKAIEELREEGKNILPNFIGDSPSFKPRM